MLTHGQGIVWRGWPACMIGLANCETSDIFIRFFIVWICMLTFNQLGFLSPPEIICSSIEDFEKEFAINLNRQRRVELMRQYKIYCNRLKNLWGTIPKKQWIDGSFVTTNPEPKDVDLVFFLDYQTVKVHEKELKEFLYPERASRHMALMVIWL